MTKVLTQSVGQIVEVDLPTGGSPPTHLLADESYEVQDRQQASFHISIKLDAGAVVSIGEEAALVSF